MIFLLLGFTKQLQRGLLSISVMQLYRDVTQPTWHWGHNQALAPLCRVVFITVCKVQSL